MLTPALLLLACAARQVPDAEPVLAALSTAPTPYTAEQLRDAFPQGTRIEFQITGEGQPPMLSVTEFVAVDATQTTYRRAVYDAAGALVDGPTESTALWTELRDHASFPIERTTWADEQLITALGEHPVTHYTVQADEPPFGPQTQHYWFAKDLPGPPLLLTIEVDGKEVQRMEMSARTGIGD